MPSQCHSRIIVVIMVVVASSYQGAHHGASATNAIAASRAGMLLPSWFANAVMVASSCQAQSDRGSVVIVVLGGL